MSSVRCPHCNVYTLKRTTKWIGDLFIVPCGACNQHFVMKAETTVWPLSVPPAPADIPEKVKEAYDDARLSHAAGANIGALMAARTALTRFLRDKGVEDFKDLVDRQIITSAIYGGIDQLRLWAGIAGHDDIHTETFNSQEVEDILDYLATALEAAYTHQARVDRFISRTAELKDMEKGG